MPITCVRWELHSAWAKRSCAWALIQKRDRVFAELESGKKVQGGYASLRRWPAGQWRLAAAGGSGATGGFARKDQGQRGLSDRCAAYLRRRRYHRVSRAGQHVDGAGPSRELPDVRRSFRAYAGTVSLRHLHHSRNFYRRPDRRKADGGQSPLRSGNLEIQRAGQRA